MKSRFGFIDPGAIMGVVVSLIILAVGVFAFFVTLDQLNTTAGGAANTQIWSAISSSIAVSRSR